MHKPALIATFLSDNYGDHRCSPCAGALLKRDVNFGISLFIFQPTLRWLNPKVAVLRTHISSAAPFFQVLFLEIIPLGFPDGVGRGLAYTYPVVNHNLGEFVSVYQNNLFLYPIDEVSGVL